MGEPSPHGDSPTVGTELYQNECGSIPFSFRGFTRDDIPQSLDSIMKNYFPVSDIAEYVGSANYNETENFDSIFSNFSFDDIIELYDSDNNHIFDFPERERVVNHQHYFSNSDSVNNLNQTRNNTLPPIAPESVLPSPSQDVIETVEAGKVGSNPVNWSVFDDEMSSTYMSHTNLTEGHGMPYVTSPATITNTSILSEDLVREFLSLDPQDDVAKKDKTSLASMEANTSPLEPSPHESSIFKAKLVPTAFNEPRQVDNSVLDTGSALPYTIHHFNQFSRSVGIGNSIDVPVTTQQINQFNHSTVYPNTSVPVTYQQTNQFDHSTVFPNTSVAVTSQQNNKFNRFAVYPGTAIKDTSQRTSQSSHFTTGLTAAMPVTSHETNQPKMYHSTSVSDASTAVTSTSCQSSQFNPSVMNANINQSNEFNQPIIAAGTILPCTSSPSNQFGLSSVCVPGHEGVSGMNVAILTMVIPLPTQARLDRAPVHANWDSLGVLQDQATNPSNKCFLDEKKRKRRERMRIASKKNRDKTKKQNMSMEAKERELSKENVKLKEDAERLNKEIEELKVKLGSKKD